MLSHFILPDDGRGKSFDSHQPSNPNTKNISICPQMTNHTKARDIHATPAAVAEGCYRHDIIVPRANLIDADASPVSFQALQLGVQHQTSEKQNKNKNQVWKDTTEKLKLKGLACDTPTTTVDISTSENTFSLLLKRKITTTWTPDRKGEVETLPTDANKIACITTGITIHAAAGHIHNASLFSVDAEDTQKNHRGVAMNKMILRVSCLLGGNRDATNVQHTSSSKPSILSLLLKRGLFLFFLFRVKELSMWGLPVACAASFDSTTNDREGGTRKTFIDGGVTISPSVARGGEEDITAIIAIDEKDGTVFPFEEKEVVSWEGILKRQSPLVSPDYSESKISQRRTKKCPKSGLCPCSKPDHLCKFYDGCSSCQKGREFSKKCKSDTECYSGSCNEVVKTCSCPKPENCNGCNNSNVPCLRVEHHGPQTLGVCTLRASTTKKGTKGSRNLETRQLETAMIPLELFDVGAAHTDLYTNLDKVVKSSSKYCLAVVPFNDDSKSKLPPAFVQASVLTEDARNISQVEIKGLRDSFLGLQIFVDENWIAHVGRADLVRKVTKGSSGKGSSGVEHGRRSISGEPDFVDIVKDVYERVHIESINQLQNDTFISSMRGKRVLVVPVPGRAKLDFDLPHNMGIEFSGEGPEVSEIEVIGTVQLARRTNFKNLSIALDHGALNITGSLIFQSSQILNINRCPPTFEEYNDLCFLVSKGIEQADDAHDFCENFELASLAKADDVVPYLQNKNGSVLKRNIFAWIEPHAGNECTSIDSAGVIYGASQIVECGNYLKVICSVPVRDSIFGVEYTSYSSNEVIGTYRQDFYKRVVDKKRLPFSFGGTLSFLQEDLFEESNTSVESPVLFTAPDVFPNGVSVKLKLHDGESSNIQVALDTFNSTGHEGYEWQVDENATSLPTKIQLHVSNASVCVEEVEILVHNGTGHGFPVARFPAELFAACLDYNVCSRDDERLCGQSLMYYDATNKCARLQEGSSVIPRDLSFDLLSLECSRLTTWNHPDLGSPFILEARVDDMIGAFEINEVYGEGHQYMFQEASNLTVDLEESNVLPIDFDMKGGGLLRSIHITRYGLNVSGLEFSLLWDCINICEAIGTPMGAAFSPEKITSVTTNFIAEFECHKLIEVQTSSGYGRERCTSPSISVNSLAEVVENLANTAAPDTVYKTLTINVTKRLVDEANVTLPSNRGLILYQDIGVNSNGGSVEGANFHVADLAELYFEDLKLNGTTRIFTDSLGQVEIGGTDISIESSEPFLVNKGQTNLASVALFSNSLMKNIDNGRIEQTYVQYYDMSGFVNSPNGTLRVSRLSLYEQFSDMDAEEIIGVLETPDGRRMYKSVDDEDDQDCDGSDLPDMVLSDISTQECQQECENRFLCSGVITSFSEGLPRCGLCLRETQCSFDCSSFSGGAYFKAVSKFHYSKVSVCPYISRPFKVISTTGLEECKLYCSYYKACEGFRVTTEVEGLLSKSCELIGDLDFAEDCRQGEATEIYVPFVPRSTSGYFNVLGNLIAPAPMATHQGLPTDQCARICDKTIACSSFQTANDMCSLYRDNNYISTNENTGLYLSIGDSFPKKRYMAYQSCYIPGSYATFTIKTSKRCRDLCNEDYSCAGFAFRPLRSLSEHNCELYDSAKTVNGLFGPELGCQRQPLRREPDVSPRSLRSKKSKSPSSSPSLEPSVLPTDGPSTIPSLSNIPSMVPSSDPSISNTPSLEPSANPSLSIGPSSDPSMTPSSSPTSSGIPSMIPSLSVRPSQESETYDLFIAFSSDTYTSSSDRAFEVVHNVTGLVEDECKALCFYERNCLAVRYNISSSGCEIGFLADGSSTDSPYLVLDSLPADETSRYASSDACYLGEKLDEHEQEVVITERALGYFHKPRTCTVFRNVVGGDDEITSAIQSPAECGLECDEDDFCVGFIHYVDHGGELNMDKIGMCRKFSSFDLGKCNAVIENMDMYLRADIGATCQATCNVHQLCSAFVYDVGICELYSDIALLDQCPDGNEKQRIEIGLSYRSRDGMVAVPGNCFVRYEDLRSLGCRSFTEMSWSDDDSISLSMTPYKCQQDCKEIEKEYYAVHDGNRCSCGSEEFLKLPVAPDREQSCSLPCKGDASRQCGGSGFAVIGETNLPLLDLTLAQCKKECFFSEFCEAIVFDTSGQRTSCELQSIGEFEDCDTNNTLYVESLEHYYEKPTTSYIGSQSIYNTTTDLKQDCQKLCDAFRSCEAMRYNDTSVLFNCELLSGEVVPLFEDEIAEGVQVARDVSLFTLTMFPPDIDEEPVANFTTTFDLDECKTLCDQHILCGSIIFKSPTCELYAKSAFVNVTSVPMNTHAPHYIDYSYFVDPAQEFAKADGLCVAQTIGGNQPIKSRRAILSANDCASHCNSVGLCSLFTFKKEENNDNENECIMYDVEATLTSSNCDATVDTYTMFTRGKFAEASNSCLKDEMEIDTTPFVLKSPYECAALCDKWFNCRSFRSDEMTGSCKLYESEQHSVDSCPEAGSLSIPGTLYIYSSDYFFTRLDKNFCVGESAITSIVDMPIEACKSMCDKSIDCLSFQHTQAGLCVLYASADFSGQCTATDDRDLYIKFKNVVNPESRFLFNELESCFDLNDENAVEINEEECINKCELSEDCFGIQMKNNTVGPDSCILLDGGSLPDAVECSNSRAFLKTKLNPYKKLNDTCLQNRITFTNDGVISNKEDYECMALCNIHPNCRYFLHGTDSTSGPNLQIRECILFKAQAIEVDDCDNERGDANFIRAYEGLTAYVNGRTFIDQITWFGEPETNFAKITGITYQECASLCDSLEDCDAFVHTWNYRRAPLGTTRSLLFTNTRLTRLDFNRNGDHKALFLKFDLESSQLVLDGAISDDDVKKQLVSPELTGSDTFKLRFWSSSGQCLSGKTSKNLESNFTVDVIRKHFQGETPVCQKLGISDCSEPDVIKFEDFSNARFGEVINLTYEDGKGCVRLHRDLDTDIDTLNTTDGILDIPPIFLNQTMEDWITSTWCERNETSSTVISGSCDNLPINEEVCANSTSDVDEEGIYTVTEACQTTSENCVNVTEVVEVCTCVPTENNCTSLTCQNITNIVEGVKNCTYATEWIETTHRFLQKTAVELLNEMFQVFETSKECLDDPDDRVLFSSTFSGTGCDFEDDIALFPSQEFTWTSDAVILQNIDLGLCLSKGSSVTPSLTPCSTDASTQWVYLFTFGHLYYTDEDVSNNMMCLTRHDDNSIFIEGCDKDDVKQRWEYNADLQTISAVDELVDADEGCLQGSRLNDPVDLGNCTDSVSKWSRFEECRLNTRERTGKMKVESISNPGQCIDFDSSNIAKLKDCSNSANWQYYYDGNNAKLAYADDNSERCLGRLGDFGLRPLPQDLPTGLMDCSTTKTAVYSRMAIAGEESNVFQWSRVNTTLDPGVPIEPFYCVEILPTTPQPQQQSECPANLTGANTWRKYGDSGDATEISVKPSATLQDISDPEVLFQFYLFTAQGKASRIIRSRMAVLLRDVERLKGLTEKVLKISAEALGLVSIVRTPIDTVNSRLDEGESAFNDFKTILTPLAKIPKVGPIFKAINIPVKAVAKAMKTGSSVTDKVNKKVNAAESPIQTFYNIVEKVRDTLPILYALDIFVDLITRSSFCAYRQGDMEHYDLTQTFIRILTSKIKISAGFIADIKVPLEYLNSFKSSVTKYLLNPIKGFNDILNPLFDIIDSLDFLRTIANFKIPIPWVSIKFGFETGWVYAYPTFEFSFDFKYFGLEDIGNFLKKIMDILKGIPGVGWILEKVDDAITSAINALLEGIGIEIPSFGLDVPFLDTLDDLVEEAKREFQKFMDFITGIMDMDGAIDDFIEPLTSAIADAVPSFDFLDVDLGCNKTNPEECIFDMLSEYITVPSFDVTIPDMKIGDIDLKVPEELSGAIEDIANNVESVVDDMLTLFDDMGCDKYETMPIDIAEYFEGFTGLSPPFPKCPMNVEICTSLRLPGLQTFSDGLMQMVDDSITRRHRNLSTSRGPARSLSSVCQDTLPNGDPWNGGISIPLDDVIRRLWYLGPRARNVQGKLKKLFVYSHRPYRSPFKQFQGPRTGFKQFKGRTIGPIELPGLGSQFKIGIPSVKLLLGCKGGEFQAEFSIAPLIELTTRLQSGIYPTDQAKYALNYWYDKEKLKTEFPDITDRKAAEERQLKTFRDDAKLVENVFDILCYLDYMYVTKEIFSYFDEDFNPLLFQERYDGNDLYNLLTKLERNQCSSATRCEDYRQNMERQFKLSQKARFELLHLKEDGNIFEKEGNIFKINAFYRTFNPKKSRATKKTCGHLYHGRRDIIEKSNTNAGTALEFGKNLLRTSSLNFFSYNKLYGSLYDMDISSRQLTASFEYGKDSMMFNPKAILLKLLIPMGIRFWLVFFSAIDEERNKDDDDDRSFGEIFADKWEQSGDVEDFFRRLFLGSCPFNKFVEANLDFVAELVPSFKLGTLWELNPATSVRNFRSKKDHKDVGSELNDGLLSAMIAVYRNPGTFQLPYLPGSVPGIVPRDRGLILYSDQTIRDIKFSFVSFSINLPRDYETTREIGKKKKSYGCAGRICFYPFETDPKAILDPEIKIETCLADSPSVSPGPSVSFSPSSSTKPSVSPSDNPSSQPSDNPS